MKLILCAVEILSSFSIINQHIVKFCWNSRSSLFMQPLCLFPHLHVCIFGAKTQDIWSNKEDELLDDRRREIRAARDWEVSWAAAPLGWGQTGHSATASRAWTPFPDLFKWETTESWIQTQAFCDGRHVSKSGSRSFCVSSCIMGMWWLNGTWSCTQGFLGYVDCYWWGQDCKEEAPFSPLSKPRPSLSEELEG